MNTDNQTPVWLQSETDLMRTLNTDSTRGLGEDEALKRLQKIGLNQLPEQRKGSVLRLFIAQFSDLMIWILIAAGVLAGVLGDWIDALAIIVIVLLNACLGFFQEYKAERTLASLRKMETPESKVIRDGTLRKLPAHDVVPGDLVLIEAGDRIPADGRFIRAFNLSTQEAALTGESVPVSKIADSLEVHDLSVSEKKNMGFLGTAAVSGKAYMTVTSTGVQTELGKTASLLQQITKDPTPLQEQLRKLGLRLVWLCLGVVSLIFLLGYINGTPLVENLLISISLAVAAIPEGLPAIVTITLAIGVRRMAKRNALIRRLPSVETLGCTTVICTDKTGTLTKNEMTVRSIWVNNTFIEVTGTGYSPDGSFEVDNKPLNPQDSSELLMALKIGTLCNSAELHEDPDNSKGWTVSGDPTEGALLTVAGKAGLFKKDLEKQNPILSEVPFDSERKRMSIARKTAEGPILYIKGAADVLLPLSAFLQINGNNIPMTAEHKDSILSATADLASQGLRVLAVGYRSIPEGATIDDSLEDQIIFVGLIAMMDPPRPEVKESIAACESAGIKTVMITGDDKNTAIAIAKELNLWKDNSIILTGAELDQLDEAQLKDRIRNIVIYARTSSKHKQRIIEVWKSLGDVVAMTGDGVNDSPALKEADIGIAMGITGTDVTKEASDMVITDDNFASIANAVEEGRGIYDNITKFVSYLASSNVAEVIIVFAGMLIGFKDLSGNPFVPLSAIQILWINLASDGLPAIALGLDPINPNVMKRAPRKYSDPLISRQKVYYLLSISLIIAIGTLFGCYYGMQQTAPVAQTMAFTTLVILELVAVYIIRAQYNPNAFSNPYVTAAVITSFLLQLLILYNSFFQKIFRTVPLSLEDCGVIAAIAGVVWVLCDLINLAIPGHRSLLWKKD